ncbi:MAG: VOC family protein, partial [Alphaproteobacteria bacterium]
VVRLYEEGGAAAGYGERSGPARFWIGLPHDRRPASAGNGVHVCFAAPDRAAVDAFHRAALAAGGADDGAPGLRPEYHQDYYGAFVRDPDGNKIEAVFRKPV